MTTPSPASGTPIARPALAAGERAIAHSVVYAALFDYPLTLAQLRQTLVESEQTATDILTALARSPALRSIVGYEDGYFFPSGRRELIAERRRREARSRAFLSRHRLLLRLIAALPYVQMVALSGSVAHMNLEGHGDLDLFIVTRGQRVWSVTVAVIVLAKVMRRRRTLCANFVVADSALAMAPEDLFTASQIIHLKPLIGEAMYRCFLDANPWVGRFYRNFHAAPKAPFGMTQRCLVRGVKRVVEWAAAGPSIVVEAACRTAYGHYLQRRSRTWRSPDQVRLDTDRVKLHTQSHRSDVLSRYDEAIREIGRRLPLD